MLEATSGMLRSLPKAELHCHLDGSLRPDTMLELAEADGLKLPAREPEQLADFMRVDHASNLEEYLDLFRVTLRLMQEPSALERIAYELAEDNARENVRYLEVRFSPVLNTTGGLGAADVLDAALRGLARAEDELDIQTGVIVCALRTLHPEVSLELAELAASFRGRGVVAFDLAGAERGYPAREHLAAFEVAHSAGLGVTVHAGEAFGPASIYQATHHCDAQRLGHGTRLHEDAALESRVRDRGIPLEICITSNVQTRAVPTFADHSVRHYFDTGLTVALCTDNRLMSGTTVTREYELARDHLGFTWEELKRVARMGFEAAFLTDAGREAVLAVFDSEVAALEGEP